MIPPTPGITDGSDPNSPLWDGTAGVTGSPNGGDWHDFDIRSGEPTARSIDDWLNKHFSKPSPQVSEAPPGHTIGEVYIEMGRKYHLNPAFVLAIFSQESTAATLPQGNMAARNYGNIKWTADCSCPGPYISYMQDPKTGEWVSLMWRTYKTWTDGMEDLFRMLKNFYVDELHLTTVSQAISMYENNDPLNPNGFTQAYIRNVQDWITMIMNGY